MRLESTFGGGPLRFARDGAIGPFPASVEAGVGRPCPACLLPWHGTIYGPRLAVVAHTKQCGSPGAAALALAGLLDGMGYRPDGWEAGG